MVGVELVPRYACIGTACVYSLSRINPWDVRSHERVELESVGSCSAFRLADHIDGVLILWGLAFQYLRQALNNLSKCDLSQ